MVRKEGDKDVTNRKRINRRIRRRMEECKMSERQRQWRRVKTKSVSFSVVCLSDDLDVKPVDSSTASSIQFCISHFHFTKTPFYVEETERPGVEVTFQTPIWETPRWIQVKRHGLVWLEVFFCDFPHSSLVKHKQFLDFVTSFKMDLVPHKLNTKSVVKQPTMLKRP